MPEPSGVAGGVSSGAAVDVAGPRPGTSREARTFREQRTFREPLWRDVVGEVLREERQTKERTLKDVADAARISMPYLSEIERGRKEASSEVLAAATRALGISMTELLVRVRLRLVEHERAAFVSEHALVPEHALTSDRVNTPDLAIVPDLAVAGQERVAAAQAAYVVAGSQSALAAMSASRGAQIRDALCLAA